MQFPWSRPKLKAGEQVIACPYTDCGSTDPAIPLMQLGNSVRRGGRPLGVITGQAWRCRDCKREWDVGPNGVKRRQSDAKLEPEVHRPNGPVPQVGERMPVPKSRP